MLSPGVLGRVAGRGSFFLRPLCVGGGGANQWRRAENVA